MNTSAFKYWLLLATTLACVYGSFVWWRYQQNDTAGLPPGEHASASSQPWTPPAGPPLKEFVLTDENGQPFDSKSLNGNVWVASYFFTNCPGTCWKLNQTLAEIQRTHPDSQVRYVSLTCDPQNDTPEALKKYAEHFHADPARWTFLTGDFKLLQQIANDFFRVGLDRQTHSDRAFVVDRGGRVRGGFRLTEPHHVELLEKLIEQVEAEPADAAAPGEPPGSEPATDAPAEPQASAP